MKKAVYRLILFAAITAFVLSLSPSVKAEPNDMQTKQNQHIASDTKALCNADKPEPAPHQKSAVGKENSQLQLAKEQLRGDFYKDSQDNLKSALYTLFAITIAVILSAFGVIAYFIFKDKRDYKDAVEAAKEAARDAKDAAKNARGLEKEAQQVLVDIKKQAKTTREEIKTTGKEERKKSSDEAERQRKISELFNKGSMAFGTKDYETSAEFYRQIVKELKEENIPSVYDNWGLALSELAKGKKGPEAKELFNQAFEKYEKAIDVNPDEYNAYNNWGFALVELAKKKKDKEREEIFEQAEEKCLKAESIKTGEGAYNLACVYAQRGNEEKCREWLKVAEKAGTLYTREDAMADDDLKSVRDKNWFKKLRWKGE